MDLKYMKTNIKDLMDKDYENFVKSIISIEKNIDDLELLDDIYMMNIDNDYIQLLLINLSYSQSSISFNRGGIEFNKEKKNNIEIENIKEKNQNKYKHLKNIFQKRKHKTTIFCTKKRKGR